VTMHRLGLHGDVGYLAFRHRQTNANLRSRGKWRQNACVCVCVCVCDKQHSETRITPCRDSSSCCIVRQCKPKFNWLTVDKLMINLDMCFESTSMNKRWPCNSYKHPEHHAVGNGSKTRAFNTRRHARSSPVFTANHFQFNDANKYIHIY
jgi:hypothetical protein